MRIPNIGVWSAEKFELLWRITSFIVYLVQ